MEQKQIEKKYLRNIRENASGFFLRKCYCRRMNSGFFCLFQNFISVLQIYTEEEFAVKDFYFN